MTPCQEIQNHFASRSKVKHSKFFAKPCFACVHKSIEYDGDEYSINSWPCCKFEYEDGVIEHFVVNKDGWPLCESPKRCSRSGRLKLHHDYFEYFGYGFLDDQMHNYGMAGRLSRFYHQQSMIARK
jgi:hypothetical protein